MKEKSEKSMGKGPFRLPRYAWVGIVLLSIGIAVLTAYWLLGNRVRDIILPNTAFTDDHRFAEIRPGSDAESTTEQLVSSGIVRDGEAILRWLRHSGLGKERLFSGRYRIARGSSTRTIARRIISRQQTPVMLVVPTVRTLEELSGRLCARLALDSSTLIQALRSDTIAARYGLTVATLPTMIIPNSYEVYWDISLTGLLDRLQRESERFWQSNAREQTAQTIGLTPEQVYTLASIIQEEAMRAEELPIIAGVYMNRLAQGMLLSACPTAKYAAGDLGISRVLTVHTTIDSEYNTYIHPGLPPGPIRITSIQAIDAVLQYMRHGYLYFCAKSDFSGYHDFSSTGEEHMRHAREYRRALNRRLRSRR